jgi:hypothetical protein
LRLPPPEVLNGLRDASAREPSDPSTRSSSQFCAGSGRAVPRQEIGIADPDGYCLMVAQIDEE